MNDLISYNDLIQIFLSYSIYDIKNEREMPNINFIFNEDGYDLLNSVIKDNEHRLHHSTIEDLDYLKTHSNDDCISLVINDAFIFFKYLTDIVNESLKLFREYGDNVNARETTRYLLRRIWLRMGINDIQNVELFLKNQLEFIKDRTFNIKENEQISEYEGEKVLVKTKPSELWDESTRSMIFTLENESESYELPHILYDINEDGICYVFGVQSAQVEKSKRIERKLYKLNKGIDNPNIHPSKVLSMLLFINELKKKNISKIVVPSMQVLSYDYHILLSKQAKKNYLEMKKEYEKNPEDIYLKGRLDYLENWFNHVYEKQDLISYLKTEELFNLIYRLTFHDPDIEITNEVNIQGDSINISL